MKILYFLLVLFFPYLLLGQEKSVFTENSDDEQEWKIHTKDGCEIFLTEMGKGPTVVVLHGGWGAEHSYMIDGFKQFSKNYHLVFYDQRGSLRSPCQSDSLISVKNHVDDLELIRKELKEDKLIIIAHSMGGMLAMNYIDKYHENVKGLILLASPSAIGNLQESMQDEQQVLKRWERPEVIKELEKKGLAIKPSKDRNYTQKDRSIWHSITFAAINLHDVRLWEEMKGEFFYSPKAGMFAAQSMPETWDFTKKLDSLNIPVYVIHGDDDFISLEKHKEWIAKTKNIELKIVKDAGHISWIDQPEQVRSLIVAYLSKIKN